jgi:Ca-activated chloride channel family protein
MIAMSFLNIKMAWFLLLPLFFMACYWYYSRRRQADLDSFAGALKLTQAKSLRPLKLSMLCAASVLLTIALMEPVWQKTPKELKKEGRDLVFVLDVSNSMKARDLIPNRLEKAKISITECVNNLKDHRVGLVIFAGSSSIRCPLTLDYEFFLHILSRVNANDT